MKTSNYKFRFLAISLLILPLVLLLFTPQASSIYDVSLTIKECLDQNRTASSPITVGVPFAQGELTNPQTLGIKNPGGAYVDAEFDALSYWPDGSVKWLLANFQASPLNASQQAVYTLTNGSGDASGGVTAVKDGKRVTVNTGAMEFVVKADGFNLFDQVKIGSNYLINSGHQAGAVIINTSGTEFKSVNDTNESTIEILESGPMRAVIRVSGWHEDSSGQKFFSHKTWIYAYKNSTYVDVDYELINEHDSSSNNFNGVYLNLPLNIVGSNYTIKTKTADPAVNGTLGSGQSAYIYQSSHNVFSSSVGPGDRASPWLDIRDSSGKGVTVATRWFWQTNAKRLEASYSGNLKVSIWPAESAPFSSKNWGCSFNPGSAIITRIGFNFHTSYDVNQANAAALNVIDGLVAFAPSSQYLSSKALGDIGEYNAVSSFETKFYSAYGAALGRRETYPNSEYGAQNFGDYLHSVDPQEQNFMNGQYDPGGCILINSLRIATQNIDRANEYYKIGTQMVAHFKTYDLNNDNIKTPYIGLIRAAATDSYTGHPHLTTKFDPNYFSGFYARKYPAEGMGFDWVLRGDYSSKEAFGMAADAIEKFAYWYDWLPNYPEQEGISGSPMMALITAYQIFGDMKYLEAAYHITTELARRIPIEGYYNIYTVEQAGPGNGPPIGSPWMRGYAFYAIQRIYEICQDLGLDKPELLDLIMRSSASEARDAYHFGVHRFFYDGPIEGEVPGTSDRILGGMILQDLAWNWQRTKNPIIEQEFINTGDYTNYNEVVQAGMVTFKQLGEFSRWLFHWLYYRDHALVSQDAYRPEPINDLKAGVPSAGNVALTFTARGDDGGIGAATAYEVRYASSPIYTEAAWSAATSVTGEPTPQEYGSLESFTVYNASILANGHYYLVIRAIDEAGNISPLSNCANTYSAGQGPSQICGVKTKEIYCKVIDDFENGTAAWASSGGTFNLSVDSNKNYEGDCAMKVLVSSPQSYASIYRASLGSDDWSKADQIRMWVYVTNSGVWNRFAMNLKFGNTYQTSERDPYSPHPDQWNIWPNQDTIPANTWVELIFNLKHGYFLSTTYATLPMDDLDTFRLYIRRQGSSISEFYIDNVQIVKRSVLNSADINAVEISWQTKDNQLNAENATTQLELSNGYSTGLLNALAADHTVILRENPAQANLIAGQTYTYTITCTNEESQATVYTGQFTYKASGQQPGNQPPIAIADANPTSGDAPLLVQFTGSGSYDPDPGDSIETYEWKKDGVLFSTDINPSYNFTTPGTYYITLTVGDGEAFGTSPAIPITVNAQNLPPYVYAPIPDQTISEGQQFTSFDLDDYFRDPDTPNVNLTMSHNYTGSDLSVSINANHVVTITVLNPEYSGSNTITFTATDPGGLSASDSAVFTVTAVADPPWIQDIGNQELTEGQIIEVNVVAGDPDLGDILALFEDGSLPSLTFATLTDNGDGTGVLTLAPQVGQAGEYANNIIRVDDNGTPPLSASTPAFTIKVNPATFAPVARIFTKPAPPSGPMPLQVYFNGSESYDPDGGEITQHDWYRLKGGEWRFIGSGKEKRQIFKEVGTYYVKLIVTDEEGQTAETTVEINVTPIAKLKLQRR